MGRKDKLQKGLDKLFEYLYDLDKDSISLMFASEYGGVREKLLLLYHVIQLNEMLKLDSSAYYQIFQDQYSIQEVKGFLSCMISDSQIQNVQNNTLLESIHSKNTIQELLNVFLNIRTVETQYHQAFNCTDDSGFSGSVNDHFALGTENPL